MHNKLRILLYLFENELYFECANYIKEFNITELSEKELNSFNIIKLIVKNIINPDSNSLIKLLSLKETEIFPSPKNIAIDTYVYCLNENIITINDLSFLTEDIKQEVKLRLNFPNKITHALPKIDSIYNELKIEDKNKELHRKLIVSAHLGLKSNSKEVKTILDNLDQLELDYELDMIKNGLKVKYSMQNNDYMYGLRSVELIYQTYKDPINFIDLKQIAAEFLIFFKQRIIVSPAISHKILDFVKGTTYEISLFIPEANELLIKGQISELYIKAESLKNSLKFKLNENDPNLIKLDQILTKARTTNI